MRMPFDYVDEEYVKTTQMGHKVHSFLYGLYGAVSSVFDILFWRDVVDFRSEHIGERIVVSRAGGLCLAPFTGTGYPYDSNGKSTVLQSRSSVPLLISTALVAMVALIIGFSKLAIGLDMAALPPAFTLVGIDLDRVFCLRSIDQKALYQAIWGVAVEGNYFSEQKIKKTAPAKSKCCFQKS